MLNGVGPPRVVSLLFDSERALLEHLILLLIVVNKSLELTSQNVDNLLPGLDLRLFHFVFVAFLVSIEDPIQSLLVRFKVLGQRIYFLVNSCKTD